MIRSSSNCVAGGESAKTGTVSSDAKARLHASETRPMTRLRPRGNNLPRESALGRRGGDPFPSEGRRTGGEGSVAARFMVATRSSGINGVTCSKLEHIPSIFITIRQVRFRGNRPQTARSLTAGAGKGMGWRPLLCGGDDPSGGYVSRRHDARRQPSVQVMRSGETPFPGAEIGSLEADPACADSGKCFFLARIFFQCRNAFP
jgi:hypothetical protein